jgi:hypothetical protein
MPLFSKETFSRLVSVPLIIVFLSLGLTTWKHLLSSSENRWMSRAREARCMDYQAERLNLKSAVNAGDDAPANDLAWQTLGTSIASNVPVSSHWVYAGCHRAGDLENPFLDRSPILNL